MGKQNRRRFPLLTGRVQSVLASGSMAARLPDSSAPFVVQEAHQYRPGAPAKTSSVERRVEGVAIVRVDQREEGKGDPVWLVSIEL